MKLRKLHVPVEQQVTLALTLGLVVVVLFAVHIATASARLTDLRLEIEQQHMVSRNLRQLQGALQTANNAQRAYLRSGLAADLEFYAAASRTIVSIYSPIKLNLPSDPRLDPLLTELDHQLDDMERLTQLAQRSGYSAALALASSLAPRNTELRLHDEIDHRNSVLSALHQQLNRRTRRTWLGYAAAILLTTAFLMAVNLAIVRQLRERRHLHDRLAFEATHDALTDLPNRRQFVEWARYALGRAKREDQPLSVLFLDLDGFKTINDRLGHEAGDRALQVAGRRFREALREGDLIGRLGGDEFAVLVSNTHSVTELGALCGRLIECLATPLLLDHPAIRIGVSIGVASYPDSGNDISELLSAADSAMYEAKRQGRNRFVFHQSRDNAPLQREEILMRDLYLAIERDEFRLKYQPQIDLFSGELVGLEALLRWKHPLLGEIGPSEFIELAERSGAILPIGEWALRCICSQLHAWQRDHDFSTRMSINVTAKELRKGRMQRLIADLLEQSAIAPERLELELVERSVIDPEVSQELIAIKRLGVRIAIDDFGTGYSSLSYLKHSAVDTIKIDKSFIDGLPMDPSDCVLTRTICGLAQNLGVELIAEGVERAEQAEFLRQCDCRVGQGWLFAPALDADNLIRWSHARQDHTGPRSLSAGSNAA